MGRIRERGEGEGRSNGQGMGERSMVWNRVKQGGGEGKGVKKSYYVERQGERLLQRKLPTLNA